MPKLRNQATYRLWWWLMKKSTRLRSSVKKHLRVLIYTINQLIQRTRTYFANHRLRRYKIATLEEANAKFKDENAYKTTSVKANGSTTEKIFDNDFTHSTHCEGSTVQRNHATTQQQSHTRLLTTTRFKHREFTLTYFCITYNYGSSQSIVIANCIQNTLNNKILLKLMQSYYRARISVRGDHTEVSLFRAISIPRISFTSEGVPLISDRYMAIDLDSTFSDVNDFTSYSGIDSHYSIDPADLSTQEWIIYKDVISYSLGALNRDPWQDNFRGSMSSFTMHPKVVRNIQFLKVGVTMQAIYLYRGDIVLQTNIEIMDGDSMSVISNAMTTSKSYYGDSESEEEKKVTLEKVYRMTSGYIPEYRQRFNGYPWRFFVQTQSVSHLQYYAAESSGGSASYEDNSDSIRLQVHNQQRKKRVKQKLSDDKQNGYITNTESSEALETLSLQSLVS